MKKVLMVLLVLTLILSMAGISSAVGVVKYDTEQTGTATVSLSLHSIYTVTLPGNIVLDYNDVDAFVGQSPFTVEIQRIGADEVLNVTVTGSNSDYENDKWYLKDSETGVTIAYRLGVGTTGSHIGDTANDELTPTTNNLLVPNTRTSVRDQYLHALVPASSLTDSLSNEEYIDTLTFTVYVGPGSVSS